MGYGAEAAEAAGAAATARVAPRLSRGVSATWWYTFGTVVFFVVMLVLFWEAALVGAGFDAGSVLAAGLAGVVWIAATVPMLLDYRRRDEDAVPVRRRRAFVPLLVALACSLVLGYVTGIWVIAAVPLVEAIVLLNWGPGIRLRVVLVLTVLLAALWAIDARFGIPADGGSTWFLLGFYPASLPAITILSLWWWDVVLTLDRARAAEARLAATQERLRVATDVHDLQGHHLQVIALQLELAERLMTSDPDAALAQVRAARSSVDEARQGTRDLALRFRSVPLRAELANAVDLLRAAGVAAETTVDRDADLAPAAILGPVIREATTNALRHGGGRWALLSLARDAGTWRLAIENDADDRESSGDGGGSGLPGIARRVSDAGGALAVEHRAQSFRLVVTVPVEEGGA
ncbi:sensor histidine kinase [Leifsonia aquatica]|uniref:sensor histidine kinase n=1 Tax=Leifsonia aquatica TaxID=144185 RepID=UPI00385159CB